MGEPRRPFVEEDCTAAAVGSLPLISSHPAQAAGPDAGVSPTTGLNLEINKEIAPQRRTIRKLAQALGVDPADLIEG